MKRFVNITRQEMQSFLLEQGFQQMFLPNVNELVFGKIVHKNGHKLSVRVYTAINQTGESRECGSDAIRIQIMFKYNNEVKPVGRSQKCLRTKNWRTNILKAIENQNNWKVCPKCGNPMVDRKGKNGNFWGCVTYFDTQCNGKKNVA
jgi:hypothetical protein